MLAPRSDDPRRSSPAYGVSSHPFGSRRCSAVALASTAIIVRAAAIPSEYFRFAAILVSIITSRVVMSGRTWTRRPPESRRRTEDRLRMEANVGTPYWLLIASYISRALSPGL